MKSFSTLIAIASLMTSLAAADDTNQCGTSTFDDIWSDSAPSVSDCQKLDLGADMQNYNNGGTGWTIVDASGTCGFVVKTTDKGAALGKQDLTDLVNSSIGSKSKDGKVQVSGTMSCNRFHGDTTQEQMEWKITKIIPSPTPHVGDS